MKKAFTLAEVMITLTVIGIITSIIIPVAINSKPDENIMKFKKAHNTLYQVISELVNSDKYYYDGDLGMKADKSLIDGSHSGDITYFCNSFADVVSTKGVNCSKEVQNRTEPYACIFYNKDSDKWEEIKKLERYDIKCKEQADTTGAEIVTSDGVVFYQGLPAFTFGITNAQGRKVLNDKRYCQKEEVGNYGPDCDLRWFSSPNGPVTFPDENGFDSEYKLFCMDIDGINNGEDPFAYGIRADGKILVGYKAKIWLEKSIQGE